MTLKERSEGRTLRRRFVVLIPTLLLLHLQKSLEVSSREMRLKGAQPVGPKGLTWTEGLHFWRVVSRWCCAVPCQGLVSARSRVRTPMTDHSATCSLTWSTRFVY